MARVRHYRELVIWQKAMEFITHVYEMTKQFPGDERYGLTNQLRRAAVSIAANIAEGSGRQGNREMQHFLSIALGSIYEVDTLLCVASQQGYISAVEQQDSEQRLTELARMNNAMQSSLRRSPTND